MCPRSRDERAFAVRLRRVGGRKQFRGIRGNKDFNFATEESGFEERIEDRVLRHEFIADRVADRLRQPLAMARDHSLRPDGETQEFDRLVRMKQHPNRQPRRAIAVQGGDDDDRHADQNFEGDWIDGVTPDY